MREKKYRERGVLRERDRWERIGLTTDFFYAKVF